MYQTEITQKCPKNDLKVIIIKATSRILAMHTRNISLCPESHPDASLNYSKTPSITKFTNKTVFSLQDLKRTQKMTLGDFIILFFQNRQFRDKCYFQNYIIGFLLLCPKPEGLPPHSLEKSSVSLPYMYIFICIPAVKTLYLLY